ncbi:MAG: hypothetical protein KAT83_00695 [Candidatus Aenigmarchaeota archaeon]|nr:hypothetical protein [Candidatus Aenigmarchaeota archaeon]
MKKKIYLLILIFALAALQDMSYAAREYQVGVSPPLVDLGILERGQETVAEFFIVTASTEDLLVQLKATRGMPEFFNKPAYSAFIGEYSEEDTASWVLFPNNPVVLSPQEKSIDTSSGALRGWRKINIVIKVPEGAEPGYHLISIHSAPYVPAGEALGVNIVAVSPVNIIFRVPGDAVRQGQILDMVAGRENTGGRTVNVFFKNTGTVTISAMAENVVVYEGNSSTEESRFSGQRYIPPTSTQTLAVVFGFDEISPGTHEVFSEVDYMTSRASKSADVTFKELVQAEPSASVIKIPTSSMPWWVFIVPVALFFIVIYSRRGESQRQHR